MSITSLAKIAGRTKAPTVEDVKAQAGNLILVNASTVWRAVAKPADDTPPLTVEEVLSSPAMPKGKTTRSDDRLCSLRFTLAKIAADKGCSPQHAAAFIQYSAR